MYRELYSKEIRPSGAYVEVIHTCLGFLASVIRDPANDKLGKLYDIFDSRIR